MIRIIGKGNGEAEVFEDESPPKPHEHDFGDSNVCRKCGAIFGGAADPRILGLPVEDDDLRPAGSNAAPPLTSEQAQG